MTLRNFITKFIDSNVSVLIVNDTESESLWIGKASHILNEDEGLFCPYIESDVIEAFPKNLMGVEVLTIKIELNVEDYRKRSRLIEVY